MALPPDVMELFEKDPLPRYRVFARMIAQHWIDPLPLRELGEPFDFKAQKRWRVFEICDFTYISSVVPLPNSDVDLIEANERFEEDVEHSEQAINWAKRDPKMRRELSKEKLCRIITVLWDWARFWAYRHPDPEIRRKNGDAAEEVDTKLQAVFQRILDLSRGDGESDAIQ
jgi:hypothetical protein